MWKAADSCRGGDAGPLPAYLGPMADLLTGLDPEPPVAPTPTGDAPLADRLRPRALGEVVGQEHLTGPDGAIGRMVAGCRR